MLLAIEASTALASVALFEGENLLAEHSSLEEQTLCANLIAHIEAMLKGVGRSAAGLRAVAVGLGPGGYTSLRIAVATAKGLALSVPCKIVGVTSLEALAYEKRSLEGWCVCAMIRAYKEDVFAALFRAEGEAAIRLSDDLLIPAGEIGALVAESRGPVVFCGEASTFRKHIEPGLSLAGALWAPVEAPQARAVGALALDRLRRGEADDPVTLAPRYLRPSAAEVVLGKKETKGGQEQSAK